MQTYRRFVSYVYQYENGRKAGNRGFIKVEARGNTCSMQISLKGICKDENASCTVYGFKREDGLLKGSRLAECPVRTGVVQEHLVFTRNEMGEAKYGLQELSGVIFQGDDQTMYGTQWDDDPMKMENFQPDERNETKADDGSVPEEAENMERWDESGAGEWVVDAEPVPDEDLDKPQELEGENEPEAVLGEQAFLGDEDSKSNEEQEIRQEVLYEGTAEPEEAAEPEGAQEPPVEAEMPADEGLENRGPEETAEIPLPAEILSGEETVEGGGFAEAESMEKMEQNVKLTDVLDTTIPVSELPADHVPEPGMEYKKEFQMESDNGPGAEAEYAGGLQMKAEPEPEYKLEAEVELRPEPGARPGQELEAAAVSEPGPDQMPQLPKADRKEPLPSAQAAKRGPKKNDQEGYIKPEQKNFCPFSDGVLEDCQKIKISELRFLDSRDQNLRNNRFVQHGYQMFGHLLLARIARNGQYILGVPGMYQQQEKFMADMFGFHNFKYAKRGGQKQSGFGYWYRLIYPPKLDRGNGRPKQL